MEANNRHNQLQPNTRRQLGKHIDGEYTEKVRKRETKCVVGWGGEATNGSNPSQGVESVRKREKKRE